MSSVTLPAFGNGEATHDDCGWRHLAIGDKFCGGCGADLRPHWREGVAMGAYPICQRGFDTDCGLPSGHAGDCERYE